MKEKNLSWNNKIDHNIKAKSVFILKSGQTGILAWAVTDNVIKYCLSLPCFPKLVTQVFH